MQAYKRNNKTTPVKPPSYREDPYGCKTVGFDRKRQAPVHPRRAFARALAKLERAGRGVAC